MKKLRFLIPLLFALTCTLVVKGSLDSPISPHSPTQKSMCPVFANNDAGGNMTVFAGNDTLICLSTSFIEVNGQAENYHFVGWASTGEGFFDSSANLNTVYFPSEMEIDQGAINLYLVAISSPPEYHRIVDSLYIEITPEPQCFAGTDATICQNKNYQLLGEASNYSGLSWSTSGDGIFDNANILNPVYSPGPMDIQNGHTLLSLRATQIEPCSLPIDNSMTLTIVALPVISLDNNALLCEGNHLGINAEALNYTEIIWTSSGDGIFSNSTIQNPVYVPGSSDTQEGSCDLFIMLSPNSPCDTYVFDNIHLTIQSEPVINTGSDRTICEQNSLQCSCSAQHFSELEWRALGNNGSFDNPFIEDPIYTPGDIENGTGFFIIRLTASSLEPCNLSMHHSFRVDVIKNADVSAGEDQYLCDNDSSQLNGEVTMGEYLYWETTGNGTFDDALNISPMYFPGSQDRENGMVELILFAGSISPCSALNSDTVKLFLEKQVSIDDCPDATVCSQASLSGNAENYASVYWTSGGDGSFSAPNDLNTEYFAGPQDMQNLGVTLSLLASPNSPCSLMVYDEVVLSFEHPVVGNYNLLDQEIITGETITLSFEASSFSGISYQWYFNENIMEGENSSGLLIENALPANAGSYYCTYTNDCSQFSSDISHISILDPATQIISINHGWNAISSYIHPVNADLPTVLNPIIDDLVILYNDEGIFWPETELITFNNWVPNMGYVIKITNPSNLLISGYIKYPQNPDTIALGWSMLATSFDCPLAVENVFGNTPQITIIKEVGGLGLYWPAKGINTLENINPGKAYEIFNASNTEIPISFPGCED